MNIAKTLLTILLLTLIPVASHANDEIFGDEGPEYGNTSDMHAAAAAGLQIAPGNNTRVLVGISYHGLNEDRKPGQAWRLFWINGNIAFDPNPKNAAHAYNYEMEITPFSWLFKDGSPNMQAVIKLGQFNSFQNNELDIGGYNIKVFGVKFDISEATENKGGLIGSVVVNALGYSLAQQLSTGAGLKSQGVYIAGGRLSYGYEGLLPQNIFPRSMRFRAGFDASIEAATSFIRGDFFGKLALVSRNKYSEFQIFVKAGEQASSFFAADKENSNAGNNSAALVITGLSLSW